MTEHQSRAFVRTLRYEVTRLSDKDQLLMFARRWLYDHQLLIEHDRAVRNGSVWVDHSLLFRGRARLFFTPERCATESKRHYARLDFPTKASTFLVPLLARVRTGVAAVAKAARDGTLRVDDELHLTALPAEDEDPKVIQLRAQLDQRLGEVQAVADGLSLLANTVMAWNTMQMQAVVNRWANRRQVIEAESMAKIAPTRLSGINLRGVFRFPVERYVADLMPSLARAISAAVG